MAKRLVRAKHKIKAARIPYRVPAAADLPERLHSVLSVVFLIYNTGADDPSAGLLALMLLNESRQPARLQDESVVLLRDQDRTKWDHSLIDEGHTIVRACLRRNQPGPYQLQAAIQAVHCGAAPFEATDWHQIVTLYDHLLSFMPTPVVALNRAIAVGECDGPAVALAALDAIAPDLDTYHLLHAARGTTLHRLGRADEARAAYEQAAELATTDSDRRFLQRQVRQLDEERSS